MDTLDQRRLAYHGAIVFVLSLTAGTVFMISLVYHWDAEPVRAWGAAHRASIVLAVWLLAMASLLPKLILTQRASRIVAQTLIWGVYMITIACYISAIAGVRGLAFAGPAINVVVWSVNGIGGILTFVGATLILIGAHNAMSEAPPSSGMSR